MRLVALRIVGVVACVLLSARVHAQVPCASDDRAICPASSYSCWHVLTPALYRLHNHSANRAAYLFASDACAPISGSYRVTVFPCRAVDQATYYSARPAAR